MPPDNSISPTGEALLKAAKLLHDAGENKDALKLIKKAMRECPESVDICIEAGLIQMKLEDLESAEICFKKALTIDPQFVEPMKNLGLIYLQQSKNTEAVNYLTQYLERINWDDLDTLSKLAEIELDWAEKEKLLITLEDAWVTTLNPQIGYLYASQIRLWGKSAEALPIIELLVRHTSSPLYYNLAGIINQNLKNYERAASYYKKALENLNEEFIFDSGEISKDFLDRLNSIKAVIQGNLSESYLQNNQKEEALTEAESALEISRNNGYLWMAKINALKALERFQDVADTCAIVLDEDEKSHFLSDDEKVELFSIRGQTLLNVANKYKQTEDAISRTHKKYLKAALAVYDKAQETFPGRPKFHFEAGRIYEALGQFERAVQKYESAFLLVRENPEYQDDMDGCPDAPGEYYFLLHLSGDGGAAWEKYRSQTSKELEILPFWLLYVLHPNEYSDIKYKQALESVIHQLYKQFPDDLEAIELFFKLLWSQKRLDDCILLLKKVLELTTIGNYYRAAVLNNLGFLHILKSDLNTAKIFFEQVMNVKVEPDQNETINKIAQTQNAGIVFHLEGKLIGDDWLDPTPADTLDDPFDYYGNPLDAVKYNLAALALAQGNIDEASKWATELLLSAPTDDQNRQYLDLLILSLAAQRKELKSARAAWQSYLGHKNESMSIELFAKAHPHLYIWLTQD